MKEILFEWNPWWSKKFEFKEIEREKLNEILPWIKRKEIIAITGVRRSGKTTLFYEIINHLINKNKCSPKNIFFIKADDDRIEKNNLIDCVLDEYNKWINPKGKILIFIDEIQEINNWEKTLKRIYDLNNNIKIFISGSNSTVIKDELSSALAGRFSYFEVFPFSFKEFLSAKKINLNNEFELIKNKNKLRHLLAEYISDGSFPEVVLEKKESIKKELLGFYFDSIFYRDVIKRKQIRNPAKMENLIKYYLQNIANLANFTKIGKLLNLTTDTIGDYTKFLENAYLIFSINIFDFSYKKQIINPKKIYCVDSGIRNLMGFTFSQDIGRLYENTVFIELRRLKKEIYYWTGKNECDFIVKEGKKLEAVQVCYDIKTSKEREKKGLLEAMENFKLNKGLIITDNFETKEKIGSKTIEFIPLWKWLLKNINTK